MVDEYLHINLRGKINNSGNVRDDMGGYLFLKKRSVNLLPLALTFIAVDIILACLYYNTMRNSVIEIDSKRYIY